MPGDRPTNACGTRRQILVRQAGHGTAPQPPSQASHHRQSLAGRPAQRQAVGWSWRCSCPHSGRPQPPWKHAVSTAQVDEMAVAVCCGSASQGQRRAGLAVLAGWLRRRTAPRHKLPTATASAREAAGTSLVEITEVCVPGLPELLATELHMPGNPHHSPPHRLLDRCVARSAHPLHKAGGRLIGSPLCQPSV